MSAVLDSRRHFPTAHPAVCILVAAYLAACSGSDDAGDADGGDTLDEVSDAGGDTSAGSDTDSGSTDDTEDTSVDILPDADDDAEADVAQDIAFADTSDDATTDAADSEDAAADAIDGEDAAADTLTDIDDGDTLEDVSDNDAVGDVASDIADIAGGADAPDSLSDALSDILSDTSSDVETDGPGDSSDGDDTHDSAGDSLGSDTDGASGDTSDDVLNSDTMADADSGEADAAPDAFVDPDGLSGGDAATDADAGTEPALPASCTYEEVSGDYRFQSQATVNGDGVIEHFVEYYEGFLSREVTWEYDVYGRETHRRDVTLSPSGAITGESLLTTNWLDEPPSVARVVRESDDYSGDGIFDQEYQYTYDASDFVTNEQYFENGVMLVESRFVIVLDTPYLTYQGSGGDGISEVSFEMIGALPTPSRITTSEPGRSRQTDFTWDELGRPLTRVVDNSDAESPDTREEWSYPDANTTELTSYESDLTLPTYFRRSVVDGGAPVADYFLRISDCSFTIYLYGSETDPESAILSGTYDSSPETCLSTRRTFPESGLISESRAYSGLCGEELRVVDENADGNPEVVIETTYLDGCYVESEVVQDTERGLTEPTRTREGVATYTPEGWLESVYVTVLIGPFSAERVQRTWDARGNMLTDEQTWYSESAAYSREYRVRTFDTEDRELTLQTIYSTSEGEYYVEETTQTYDENWPHPVCFGRFDFTTPG